MKIGDVRIEGGYVIKTLEAYTKGINSIYLEKCSFSEGFFYIVMENEFVSGTFQDYKKSLQRFELLCLNLEKD